MFIYKFQVIYCLIPKAASTSWKKVLIRSSTNQTMRKRELYQLTLLRKYGLVSLAAFSKEEIQERLTTYFKFFVVRHPFIRLLSAYWSKFGRFGDLSDVHFRFKGYLPFLLRQKYKSNSNVTFSDFVEYITSVYNISTSFFSRQIHGNSDLESVLDETRVHPKVKLSISLWFNRDRVLSKGSEYFNHHWAQYSTSCHPCHIDYDYIVKFETMREDAAYVLSKLGPHHQCLEEKYPELFNFTQKSSSMYEKQFSTLSSQQINRLKEIYSIDFKLFGYDSKTT